MVKKDQNNSETSCIHLIKDDEGHLLNEENNVKERWKNYFESVFECEDTVADDSVTTTEYVMDDGNERMTRSGGGIVASLLYQLFNKCWESHGYLMTGVKLASYLSIKEKAHGSVVDKVDIYSILERSFGPRRSVGGRPDRFYLHPTSVRMHVS
ncbi:hypothetical protein EVAR_55341_1 [Eumeta japonica]|uniref:Uncharacterized protein n=1 Tax=Eumeta variegata TaxID=151549 RepID=A0A4C1YHS7_EUMVA|nr:hypothetical protein EVAR_55341_1 [Eumeta japonica]